MASVFRQAALDRLSSPEQLDKLVVITPARLWCSLLGVILILASALVWAVFGRIPMAVDSNGVYINRGGSGAIFSENNGVVSKVLLQDGDHVSSGEALVALQNTDLEEQLMQVNRRIERVEAITFTSTEDIVTADTQSLADLKAQKIALGSGATTSQKTLEERRKQLETQEELVADAKKKMTKAGERYFETYLDNTTSLRAFQHQNASTEYSEAAQEYSSASANYKAASEKLPADPANPTPEEVALLERLKAEMDAAESHMRSTRSDVEKYATRYEKALRGDIEDQQYSAVRSDQYSRLQSEYNSAYSTLQSLKDGIFTLEMQLFSDHVSSDLQKQTYSAQFENAKASTLSQLLEEQRKLKVQLKNTQILATNEGAVYDITVTQGSVVGAGTQVASVMYGDTEDMIIILYVPVADGKKLAPNMEVKIYPSVVNRQEYGHMRARVLSVDSYVSSASQLRSQLGNDSLINNFSQNGPVVAVRCELERDESTASGFYWSSKKGANVELRNATMVSASVITEYRAPITMLIPFLKDKLTVKTSEEAEASR